MHQPQHNHASSTSVVPGPHDRPAHPLLSTLMAPTLTYLPMSMVSSLRQSLLDIPSILQLYPKNLLEQSTPFWTYIIGHLPNNGILTSACIGRGLHMLSSIYSTTVILVKLLGMFEEDPRLAGRGWTATSATRWSDAAHLASSYCSCCADHGSPGLWLWAPHCCPSGHACAGKEYARTTGRRHCR